MSTNRIAIEALESRTLLSASPVNATAKLDRLQIRVDLLKFRADAFAGSAAILSDRLSMKADNVAAATTVTPPAHAVEKRREGHAHRVED